MVVIILLYVFPIRLHTAGDYFLLTLFLCLFQDLLKGVVKVVINCMTLRSSHSIFPLLAERLGAPRSHGEGRLEKLLTSSGPTV